MHHLQECLNYYSTLLEQLDLNATQEMHGIEGKTLFQTVEREYTHIFDHFCFYFRI